MFTSKRPRVGLTSASAPALARRSIFALIGLALLLVPTLPARLHIVHAAQADDALPTAGDIYAQVSPSIAYIETPYGHGSGILFEQAGKQYVLTNSHVVWPYQEAYIYFADGTELFDIPLIDWDLLADVAVLGPVETDIIPFDLSARSRAAVGDVAYLIGYPAETDYYPEPTMAQGIVARLRRWDLAGLAYVQTDAPSAPGQSGGVLLAEDGSFLGLSTFLLDDEGAFTLALAASDVRRRMAQIIRGYDADQLGERRSLADDIDDSRTILLDTWRYGHLDYTGDIDIFVTELEAGQYVTAWVETYAFDAIIAIGPRNAHEAEMVSDLVYGTEVDYVVPEDGEYLIMVRDDATDDTGAYLVGVYVWEEEWEEE